MNSILSHLWAANYCVAILLYVFECVFNLTFGEYGAQWLLDVRVGRRLFLQRNLCNTTGLGRDFSTHRHHSYWLPQADII